MKGLPQQAQVRSSKPLLLSRSRFAYHHAIRQWSDQKRRCRCPGHSTKPFPHWLQTPLLTGEAFSSRGSGCRLRRQKDFTVLRESPSASAIAAKLSPSSRIWLMRSFCELVISKPPVNGRFPASHTGQIKQFKSATIDYCRFSLSI